MDPNETWLMATDWQAFSLDSRRSAMGELRAWLRNGGFLPDGVTYQMVEGVYRGLWRNEQS